MAVVVPCEFEKTPGNENDENPDTIIPRTCSTTMVLTDDGQFVPPIEGYP